MQLLQTFQDVIREFIMRFHGKTTKRLKEAGWYLNRRVDISHKVEIMHTNEVFFNDTMLKFLKEFDNLKLSYSFENLFDFNVQDSYFANDAINYRSGLIGERCILIGTFFMYELEVLITDNKKMYCYDEFENVYRIGDYYDEGLDFICMYGLNPRKHLESKIV